jgi:DeoR family glycerol-3-phosphate regulon repressor
VKPSTRHDEIVRLVRCAGEMTVDQLAESLSVSRETVRRDLFNLDCEGRIRKFHGGARTNPNPAGAHSAEGPFALRMTENINAKRRIAHTAAGLLSPGDALFIDTGTTTLLFAEALAVLPPLVIITNSWKIAAAAATNADHKVFLIGGAYGVDAGESLGHLAVEQIRKFRARHVFLTVGGVDGHSVRDFDAQETEIARAMIERAEMVTVLADSSKFTKRGIFEVASWDKIHRLVTEEAPTGDIADAAMSKNIEILIP